MRCRHNHHQNDIFNFNAVNIDLNFKHNNNQCKHNKHFADQYHKYIYIILSGVKHEDTGMSMASNLIGMAPTY